MGLGYFSLDNSAPMTFDDAPDNWGGYSTGNKTGGFCFMPRAGVELFHRLRLAIDYKLQEDANRHFRTTLEVVFGSGRR